MIKVILGVIGAILLSIALIVILIVILRKRRNQKNEESKQKDFLPSSEPIKETVALESVFSTTKRIEPTLSTYQPGFHSSQNNKQTNKHILSSSHKHLIFDTLIHIL
jgi:flagellar basal body-associated protein FliL